MENRQSNRKILFLCATSKMVLHFRVDLIKKFQNEGYNVSLVAFDNLYEKQISELGVNFYCINDNNRSMNPFRVLSLKNKYYKIVKEVNPDIVFTFMLKPNIFGVLGTKKAGVKRIFSMVEGAGDVFTYNTFKWKLVRFIVSKLYRKAFKNCEKVFFINNDDKLEFISRKLVVAKKCVVVPGIGLNLENFTYKNVVKNNAFLMIARLCKSKGVIEYCNASRIVKKKYPFAEFYYLGEENSLKLCDIKEFIDEGSIIYLGETDDVRGYIENVSVTVLPSYREGLGMVNVESGAIGRAIITCDTNGTRDTVIDSYNGFLVPVKDINALVEKMEYFILNPDKVIEMGNNARKFVEEHFDQKRINEYILSIVRTKE